jgi:hypothetical protein
MTLVPLTVAAFWIGLYPAPFFGILDEPVNRLVQQVEKTHVYPSKVAGLFPELSDVARALPARVRESAPAGDGAAEAK